MAWGLWNKIKNGFRRAFNWIRDKIVKPVRDKVIKPAWENVIKPATEMIGKVPGIEKMPGKLGVVGKIGKGVNQFSPLIEKLLK